MAHNFDNPHEWFTASEAADLARRYDVEGVPLTARCMTRRLGGEAVEDLRRVRQGRTLEWHMTAFPDELCAEIEIEAQERREALICDLTLTHSDQLAMTEMLEEKVGIAAYSNMVFQELVLRKVRRSYVHIGGCRYFVPIPSLDQTKVLVSCALTAASPMGSRFAFLWKYDPISKGLVSHAPSGLIALVEGNHPYQS